MQIGTKSILFGAHQFLIHPLFLALAWWKLYGFPWDPRLWVAFFVHDLGYWGKPNMDGPEGEEHPWYGAIIMDELFGKSWSDLCLYHSRYMAKKMGKPFSKLCVADKLAVCLEPWWLYLPRVIASREIDEYMERAKVRSARNENLSAYEHQEINAPSARRWFAGVCSYLRRWVEEHKDLRPDKWTPRVR